MTANLRHPFRTALYSLTLSFLVGSSITFAQDQPPGPPPPDPQAQAGPANGGWRKVGDPPNQANEANTPPDQSPADQAPAAEQAPPPPEPPPHATMDPNYSQGPMRGQRYPNQPYAPNYDRGPIPAKLTMKAGTYITVRLSQGLSSDHNQANDSFAATLAKPVVIDGVVVAERGQTLGGRVVEAKKAGRVEGTSKLVVQLTDLTLTDGQPVPIKTQLVSLNGRTSVGRDAGAVASTTAAGAAIGAAADWGTGAAIGAGAGAVAGIVGVLVTRGRPTILYPEEILTFRVDAPVTVSTEMAPQAFRWVGPNDYDRPYDAQARPRAGYYGYGYGYPAPYPYAYAYPYYWGPGIGFYWGRGYWGRGYWGRGWRR